MAHPIQETNWQLAKIRELVTQLDTELDEAVYQSEQSEEALQNINKWEENKGEVVSLAQKALEEVENINFGSASDDTKRLHNAEEYLKGILKELEK